jgi:hypothetical protein
MNHRARRSSRRISVERVDVGSRQAEIVALLRHYLQIAKDDPERLEGLMLIAELPRGAYEVKYTGTESVAERLGRLQLLMHQMVEQGEEIL